MGGAGRTSRQIDDCDRRQFFLEGINGTFVDEHSVESRRSESSRIIFETEQQWAETRLLWHCGQKSSSIVSSADTVAV